MKIEHRLREAAARCLSLLQRYRDGERTVASKALMVAEVEVVVGWLMELDLALDQVEAEILRPVEGCLLDRYGPREGRLLYREFIEAFDGSGFFWKIDFRFTYILYARILYVMSAA